MTMSGSICTLGYFFGCLRGTVDDNVFILTSNLADMLNKLGVIDIDHGEKPHEEHVHVS